MHASTRAGLAALVFASAFLLRFLNPDLHNEHFNLYAAGHQIVAFGHLPFRDFLDPGHFLDYFLAAAAERLFGYRLLGGAVLSITVLSLATSIVFLLAAYASRSLAIAFAVTAIFILSAPLLYNHAKLFFTSAGIAACWLYAEKPTRLRLAGLGVLAGVAALTRGDLGAYIGAGALATLGVLHAREGPQCLAVRVVCLAGGLLAVLVPFWIFLQLNGGVLEYYRVVVEFGRAEKSATPFRWLSPSVDTMAPLIAVAPVGAQVSIRWASFVQDAERAAIEERFALTDGQPQSDDPRRRTWRYWLADLSPANAAAIRVDPRVEDTDGVETAARVGAWQQTIPLLRLRLLPGIINAENALPWVYNLVLATPALALVLAILRPRPAPEFSSDVPRIAGAAALGALANFVLLAQPSHTRVADLGATTSVLGAWLLGRLAFTAGDSAARTNFKRRLIGCTLAGAVLYVTAAGVAVMADAGPQLQGTTIPILLNGPRATARQIADVLKGLTPTPPSSAWDDAESVGYRAVIAYVRACTRPDDALLVTWFAPQLHYLAGRQFGGGVPFFHREHFSSIATQQLILSRLERQSVPIVLARPAIYENHFRPNLTLLADFIDRHYEVVHESSLGDPNGDVYRILARRDAQPARSYQPWGLPCFV